jgi:hypothetical protein
LLHPRHHPDQSGCGRPPLRGFLNENRKGLPDIDIDVSRALTKRFQAKIHEAFPEAHNLRTVSYAKPGGKLAVLMGDYFDPEVRFAPLAFGIGLRSYCTDISASTFGYAAQKIVPVILYARFGRYLYDL